MSMPPGSSPASAPDTPEWWGLVDAVRHAFAGSPYRVEASPERIAVQADLADARFLGLASVRRLSSVYRSVLTPKGSGRVAWEDTQETVSWTAGLDGALMPRLTGQRTGTRGRIATVQLRKELGVDADGLGFPVGHAFSSGEIAGPLKAAVHDAGFSTVMASSTVVGLVVAAIAALGVAAVGIAALLGAFSG